jgi:hypothetical protein
MQAFESLSNIGFPLSIPCRKRLLNIVCEAGRIDDVVTILSGSPQNVPTTDCLVMAAAPLLITGNTELFAKFLKTYLETSNHEEIDIMTILDAVIYFRARRFGSQTIVTETEASGMRSILDAFDDYYNVLVENHHYEPIMVIWHARLYQLSEAEMSCRPGSMAEFLDCITMFPPIYRPNTHSHMTTSISNSIHNISTSTNTNTNTGTSTTTNNSGFNFIPEDKDDVIFGSSLYINDLTSEINAEMNGTHVCLRTDIFKYDNDYESMDVLLQEGAETALMSSINDWTDYIEMQMSPEDGEGEGESESEGQVGSESNIDSDLFDTSDLNVEIGDDDGDNETELFFEDNDGEHGTGSFSMVSSYTSIDDMDIDFHIVTVTNDDFEELDQGHASTQGPAGSMVGTAGVPEWGLNDLTHQGMELNEEPSDLRR